MRRTCTTRPNTLAVVSMLLQDIDTWAVENALVAALLADATALGLVDEFYFEDHVNFSEMLGWWDNTYNPKQYDPSRSLSDSYHQFLRLRQLGVRAHSWV